MILLHSFDLVESCHGLQEQGRTDLGEPARQRRRVLVGFDGHRAGRENRAVVELLVHAHDRDASLAVAGEDGVRDRRRPPMAG